MHVNHLLTNIRPQDSSKLLSDITMFTALTLHSIIALLTPLKYHVFENIMENEAFAPKEQMLHFPLYFQKYSKLNLDFS